MVNTDISNGETDSCKDSVEQHYLRISSIFTDWFTIFKELQPPSRVLPHNATEFTLSRYPTVQKTRFP
uniref:Uncharacterized protein n=1 Tax=Anguilla anguilla TaxID=7936 RepID=A0A0E9X6D9_ANGAN